jgi:pimeloyl-ACP methyl ester carboxylesterase
MTERYAFERKSFLILFNENSTVKDTYGGAVGMVFLQAQLLKPERPSDTVFVTMHPIGGTGFLPLSTWLAESGAHVLACDCRYRSTDYALIMEKVIIDLGAAVRHAKEALGYKNVVLLGWSGGGSLSAFYQSQAEQPDIVATPAGDPVDIAGQHLIPADAIAFMSAHVSRHSLLADSIDPAILDEHDPRVRDPLLDIYGTQVTPPYDPAFLARYREAQRARVRRITAWVRAELAGLKANSADQEERAFVVHGTMADPRWLDPAIDPNDRRPGWCYLGDPKNVNMSPIGLGRYSSLRSWLSQWSLDDARADAPECITRIKAPMLVINNSADDACTPSHARRMFKAISHDAKRFAQIEGANHYFQGQPEHGQQAIAILKTWLAALGMET